MRSYLKSGYALLWLVLLFACTKKSSTPPNPLLAEIWPQDWVLTIDFGPNTYKYLHKVGIVINRNEVEKSYSMTELAKEKDCEWEVKQEGQINGKTVYSFHLQKNKNIRWMVGKTATVNGQEEWYLGTHTATQPPSENYWKFFIHFMGKKDGNKLVVIESAAKPGYYIDNIGHTLTANGVAVRQYDKPENAQHFEAH